MISQTIEYALRAMSHLATLDDGVSVNSETIASRTQVPQGYLSKILRDLVVAELIRSQRGPNGGFCLARPASQTSILDIVNAVDPIQRIRRCPLGNASHINLCPLHRRLDDALAMIEHEFRRTTIAELMEPDASAKRRCQGLLTPTVTPKPKRGG